jgi:hypothetical protein
MSLPPGPRRRRLSDTVACAWEDCYPMGELFNPMSSSVAPATSSGQAEEIPEAVSEIANRAVADWEVRTANPRRQIGDP